MNDKLRDLMIKAGYAAPELAERAQKLSELIIRECADIANEGYASSNFGNGISGYQLLDHFGVEL